MLVEAVAEHLSSGPTGVYALMRAQAGLLRETFVADLTLIGAHFVHQRLDVLL